MQTCERVKSLLTTTTKKTNQPKRKQMKKNILIATLAIISYNLKAQQEQTLPDTGEIESMNTILISAQRLGETRMNNTRQIEVISRKQIQAAQQPHTGDLLAQTGKVFVQKSQMGGGSPVLRGFESSRVLMVVDGVRVNNAVYRAGHLQDIITFDANMLDRMELYFGSGSTLYGSDALGGVIYMKTRDPRFSDSRFKLNHAGATLRYTSASKSMTENAWLEFGSKKVAWLFSATQNNFGDLKAGAGKNYSSIDTFGIRNRYVKRVSNTDVVMANDDPWRQVGTAYTQTDLFSKLLVKTGDYTHSLNLQYSGSGVIPRYDRLTDVRNNNLRYAVWDYAPQNRGLVSYQLLFPDKGAFSSRLILAHQFTEVGRVTRSRANNAEKTQLDKVGMSTLNYDVKYKFSEKLTMQGGLEGVRNKVTSTASEKDVSNNTVKTISDTRYADGGAGTFSAGLFANLIYAVVPNDLVVEAGFRASHYQLKADFTSNNFLKLPYRNAETNNNSVVWNLGISKKLWVDNLFFKASASSGLRNPNVDDMTKLFESAKGSKLVIPNSNLGAEQTITYDAGIMFTHKRFSIEGGYYVTQINNLLIDAPAQYNGNDSFLYDGVMTRVYQMTNVASGKIKGYYFNAKAFVLPDKLLAEFSYNSQMGKYKASDNAAETPLDHIAPVFGRAGLKWMDKKWWAEAFVLFNGKKAKADYSPSGEDNAQYAPGGESPAWTTYNLRVNYTLLKGFQLQLTAENLTDLHYRYFASGISAPGRNFIAALKIEF